MDQKNLFIEDLKISEHFELLKKIYHTKSIDDYLEKLEVKDTFNKYPGQLSGGEKNRISFLMCLLKSTPIIILDEPTAALDPILTSEVLEMIGTLKKERKDFIIVTHEMGFARSVADYILFVDKGKIVEYGVSKELFEKPKTEELKNFFGKILEWKM